MCSKHLSNSSHHLELNRAVQKFYRGMYGCQDIFVQVKHLCLSSNPILYHQTHKQRTLHGIGIYVQYSWPHFVFHSSNDGYHVIQQKVSDYNASQCGYCTPGMVMSMYRWERLNLSVERLCWNIYMHCTCTVYALYNYVIGKISVLKFFTNHVQWWKLNT